MATLTDNGYTRPRPEADTLPGHTHSSHEHAFDARAVFVPVRAIPDPSGPAWCEPEHRHEPLAARPGPGASLIAVDWRSRLGGWRRELVCARCLYAFLQDRVRDSDVVLVWFSSEHGDALEQPRPLGQLAEWPAEALGAVA